MGVIYGGDIGAALAADVQVCRVGQRNGETYIPPVTPKFRHTQAAGGIITAEDLGNYTAVERPVQDFWFQGIAVFVSGATYGVCVCVCGWVGGSTTDKAHLLAILYPSKYFRV